jgi:hypothetical protein
VVGEVVVVFDGLEGCGFAEEPKMVDGDGLREDGLQGVEHAEAGAEDGDEGDAGGRDGGCCVVVA